MQHQRIARYIYLICRYIHKSMFMLLMRRQLHPQRIMAKRCTPNVYRLMIWMRTVRGLTGMVVVVPCHSRAAIIIDDSQHHPAIKL
jgi:hypothetical protein